MKIYIPGDKAYDFCHYVWGDRLIKSLVKCAKASGDTYIVRMKEIPTTELIVTCDDVKVLKYQKD
jgi:hypothetical protein